MLIIPSNSTANGQDSKKQSLTSELQKTILSRKDVLRNDSVSV